MFAPHLYDTTSDGDYSRSPARPVRQWCAFLSLPSFLLSSQEEEERMIDRIERIQRRSLERQ